MLEIHDLHVSYGEVRALAGVSLTAERGSITSLIGANGAGKTTCLKAVSCLAPIQSGTVSFEGVRIDRMRPHQVAGLGIAHVPERGRLFPRMTVMQNILTGAYLRRDRAEIKRDVEAVFEQFPVLGERRSQIAKTLSGGEQQMLTLARATMSRPKLYMLDEPSLGLAPIIVAQVARQIERLADEGSGVVLVEQNARLALGLSETAYVLENGRITIEGESEQLANDPHIQNAYLGAA